MSNSPNTGVRGASVLKVLGNVILWVAVLVILPSAALIYGPRLARRAIGMPVGDDRMRCAIASGNMVQLQKAFDEGASADARYPGGQTPLMSAAEDGDTRTLRELLNHGADVSAVCQGFTVLMIAASQGHDEAVRMLLEAGADPNQQIGTHPTALFCAAVDNHVEVAALLLDYGAQADARCERGRTPLMEAVCQRDSEEMLQTLLHAGASAGMPDELGTTPLMAAVTHSNAMAVEKLVRAGADVHAVDSQGRTARSLAAQAGQMDLLALLRHHNPRHGPHTPLAMAEAGRQ